MLKRLIGINLLIIAEIIISSIIRLRYTRVDSHLAIFHLNFGDLLPILAISILFFPIIEEVLYRSPISQLNWKKVILFFVAFFIYGYYTEIVITNEFSQDLYLVVWKASSYLVPLIVLILAAVWRKTKTRGVRLYSLFLISTLGFVFQHGDLFTQNEVFGQTEGIILPVLRFFGLFALGSACFYISKNYGLKWAIATHAIMNFFSLVFNYFLIQILFG